MTEKEQIMGVYSTLLWRHLDAARVDPEGRTEKRAKIFALVLAFEDEFPEECKACREATA